MAEDPYQSPHAARFALKLVEETFGEICQRLVAALLGHGVQTFPDLLRTSGLPPSQLKSALLVLIQQNCVDTYFHEEPPTLRGPGPSYQLYEAAMYRILQIVRAPRFLTHVRDEMGSLAEVLVQKLLENGRLRIEQLVQAVQSEPPQDVDSKGTGEGEKGEGGDRDGECGEAAPGPSASELYTTFASLVKAHYVERVPMCTLPPPPKELHPNARKKKPSLKTESEEADAEQRQQADALRRQGYQQDRFKLPADLAEGMGLDTAAAAAAARALGEGSAGMAAVDGEEDGTASGKGKGKAAAAKRKRAGKAVLEEIEEEALPAKKRGRRKVKADEMLVVDSEAAGDAGEGAPIAAAGSRPRRPAQGRREAEPAAELAASEVLWRVNHEEFNRRFRNEAVVDFVREKRGGEAAAVMAGLLNANIRFESGVRIGSTAILPEADIAQATRRLNPEEYTIPQNVYDVLSNLEQDDLSFVEFQGHGPGGAQYSVDVAQVLQYVRLYQLQAVIRDRFGPSGMRIWRALLLHKQLEQKQVADFAMLPKEDARQLLYRMVRAGYVSIQDVPRTADHAPSRTFYTFRANYDVAASQLAGELYRAAGNVHARLAFELEQHKELLELFDLVTSGLAPRSVLAPHEAELARVKGVAALLESSLLHLDQMIALFNDM